MMHLTHVVAGCAVSLVECRRIANQYYPLICKLSTKDEAGIVSCFRTEASTVYAILMNSIALRLRRGY